MARVNSLLLKGLSGKIGDLSFRTQNGKTFVNLSNRRKPRTSSPAMQNHQERFRMMIKFIQPIVPLINLTNKNPGKRRSPFNFIFSENVKAAISGYYPALEINYAKVILSKGPLPSGERVKLSSREKDKIVIRWIHNRVSIKNHTEDTAFVACYNEHRKSWVYEIGLSSRKEGRCSLSTTSFYPGPVHIYFGFHSAKSGLSSNSIYLGKIDMSLPQPKLK
jgi:Family of unknown function (DUF6266)